ncbi:MAG: amidohydrolase [Candidatus Omnitrophica bacterium]|nr:amidohydrolase [Candidatus Omnitrophota bacterium]
MRVFINHCHVYPEGLCQEWWAKEGTIPNLKKCMEKLGIEKAVVFALLKGTPSFTSIDANEWLLKKIQKENNLHPFTTIVPTEKDAAKKLRKYIAKGFVGAKLHPEVQRFQINDPAAEDFYTAAEELRIPLLFHTGVHGWYLKKYRPILLDEVAQNHPNLSIIIEHVGGYAFFYETLAVLQNNKNCYAGIAQTRRKDIPWYLPLERLNILIEMVGAERIIYGADFPWNNCEGIRTDIEAINNLDIPSEKKEKILGGNLARLIKKNG